MALLAGHYHINGTLQQIEDTVEKADLDPLTPAIYGCVWCGVMAEKEDPRFKELVAFMARRSDVEPPWLAQVVDQASQDLMTSLAKEQELAR